MNESITSFNAHSTSFDFLDWRNRSEKIKEKIDFVFENLRQETGDRWTYDGDSEYHMLTISEHQLIKKIILGASKEQRDFYFLDIGSGYFQWTEALANYINNQKDIPKDITVHVIGVRGEGGESIIEERGQCKIYQLTAFKVENLHAELQKNYPFLEKKLDGVFSHKCFQHLVDPLGTFIQVYDLLRPGSGIFIGEGFHSLDKEQSLEKRNSSSAMIDLLVKTKAPFLMRCGDPFVQFILQRIDETPCQLKMKYVDLVCEQFLWKHIASECITRLDKGSEKYGCTHFFQWHQRGKYDYLYGDKKLYNWLRKNSLIQFSLQWVMTKSDYPLIKDQLKLHQAAIEGDIEAIEVLLENGLDIDESDLDGYTPLHLAMKNKQFDCFKLLLEKGANKSIPSCDVSEKSYNDFSTLFEEANEKEYDQAYIQLLL